MTLATATLDRYSETTQQPRLVYREADHLARMMAARKSYDLSSFVKRMRERYPKPTE
jgi:hypothetical protein